MRTFVWTQAVDLSVFRVLQCDTICGVRWCHAGRVNKPKRETWSPLAGSKCPLWWPTVYENVMKYDLWWAFSREHIIPSLSDCQTCLRSVLNCVVIDASWQLSTVVLKGCWGSLNHKLQAATQQRGTWRGAELFPSQRSPAPALPPPDSST